MNIQTYKEVEIDTSQYTIGTRLHFIRQILNGDKIIVEAFIDLDIDLCEYKE